MSYLRCESNSGGGEGDCSAGSELLVGACYLSLCSTSLEFDSRIIGNLWTEGGSGGKGKKGSWSCLLVMELILFNPFIFGDLRKRRRSLKGPMTLRIIRRAVLDEEER